MEFEKISNDVKEVKEFIKKFKPETMKVVSSTCNQNVIVKHPDGSWTAYLNQLTMIALGAAFVGTGVALTAAGIAIILGSEGLLAIAGVPLIIVGQAIMTVGIVFITMGITCSCGCYIQSNGKSGCQ